MVKNQRIRKAMIDKGLVQEQLSQILDVSKAEVSIMLKRELAKAEQDEIIKAIRES